MKKLLFIVVALYLCNVLYGVYQDHQTSILQEDYMKLEQVKDECDYLITSGFLRKMAPDTNIVIIDLEQMHESQSTVWNKIQDDLGEEFVTNLSNSDNIYISLNEKKRTFEIYVGNKTQTYMVYPDWKYPKISAPIGFND